ncbi:MULTISPECIES: hypothetical protein [Kitasatospora]|uniref:Glycosyltransferase RgtA/B/C/D-like domain-containing protein n=1 Tax=Kitasatospora setae (strain ATCC 33774 / DSM 43861 / JCM 3304 / KCC A-0304 / NBRC 14216 / KM-6054) TaxID=452652 RepID=E4NCC3_KITSK|nr:MULTISPECIES: hypothetical protein [Kitasatospora]BAJ28854.1 hypothetical protein KSE_30430 [Kitasatospora setae KM-6054]
MSTSTTLEEARPGWARRQERERRHRRAKSRLRLPFAVAAGCWAALLLWWAAAYPAFTGDAPDGSAPLYAAAVRLVHPGPATLLQTAAAAFALGYLVAALARYGVRGRHAGPVAVGLAGLPPTASLVVSATPDAVVALAALLLTGAGLRLLARRAEGTLRQGGPAQRLDLAVLFSAVCALALTGTRGAGTALAAVAVLLAFLPRARLRLALPTALALAVPLALGLLGHPAAPAGDLRPLRAADLAVAGRSAAAPANPALDAVAPAPVWAAAGADCSASAALTDRWNAPAADRAEGELATAWRQLLRDHPDAVLDARLCRARIAWGVWAGGDGPHAATGVPGPAAGSRGLWHPLHAAATWSHTLLRAPQLDWLLWRGALWAYLGLAAAVLYAWRHRLAALVPVAGAAVLGTQLALTASAADQDYRRMAAALLAGPLLLTLATVRTRRAD